MSEKIKWGIISTGFIAGKFAEGLEYVEDAELDAVASRTKESADKFGEQYNVPKRYGSYEELAEDPEVDVVYIGTPHSLHLDYSEMCLEAGKHVLCEKPMAINAGEATKMVNTARRNKRFLMEAMWTRYLPFFRKLEHLLDVGAIGELQMIHANFAQVADYDPQNRFFNLELGGGSLLDLGIYPLALSSYFLGAPELIQSQGVIGPTGVDEKLAASLKLPGDKMASFFTSLVTDAPIEALFMGSEGYIRIHAPWFMSEKLTLAGKNRDEQVIEVPMQGNGYNYEAEEVNRCLKEGKLESDLMPLDESLELMEVMDYIRYQIGLYYPYEI